MISCPNCGGNVKFDIPSQQLSCEYCHEHFDPYAFESKTSDAEESSSYESDYEVTIFTCPQCGGEILSTDNAAAGFCSFCGASTILYSRISHERRPHFIIPFQKSKEDCKQAYVSMMKRAIFAPKELRDPKYIDSFRGIYMPYWAFHITQKGPLNLSGQKEYRRGDYVYTDHYQLEGELDACYKGLSYDASSSFADSISESLAPFDVKGMKAFTPAYLSGFYADIADVAPSVYQGEAEFTAYDQTVRELSRVPQYKPYIIGGASSPAVVNTKTENVDSTMFPVWFMSYRKNDRIAYVTVNGQTGKVAADIPVDPKKYVAASLLLAIPLFLLFALCFTLLPSRLLILSGVLALITSVICIVELGNIVKKDEAAGDRGKMYKENTQAVSSVNQNVKPKKKKASALFQKQSRLGCAMTIAALLTVTLISLLHPVSDLFYYGGTIFALLAVLLSIMDIIRYYNILSTRRLPQFDKQGGDDRA